MTARVETPADTLRRASARVRELAAEATQGPWGYVGPERALTDDDMDCGERYDTEPQVLAGTALAVGGGHGQLSEYVHSSDLGDGDYDDDRAMVGNAKWIAALGPQAAAPLAVLLDAAAADEESHNASGATQSAFTDHALALAHALLGSPVPEPDGEGT